MIETKIESINLIDSLFKIANYYTEKYKLTTRVEIINEPHFLYGNCYFDDFLELIQINLDYIERLLDKNKEYLRKRTGCTIKKEIIISVLLHELKHAIDWQYSKEQMIKEKEKINYDLYYIDSDYHNNLPYEKRADNFAREEIKNWR